MPLGIPNDELPMQQREVETSEMLDIYRAAMAAPNQPGWSRELATIIMAERLAEAEKMTEDQIVELLCGHKKLN